MSWGGPLAKERSYPVMLIGDRVACLTDTTGRMDDMIYQDLDDVHRWVHAINIGSMKGTSPRSRDMGVIEGWPSGH